MKTFKQKREALRKARARMESSGFAKATNHFSADRREVVVLGCIDALIEIVDALDERFDEKVDVLE